VAQEFLASTTLHSPDNSSRLFIQNGLNIGAFIDLIISRIA